MAVEKTYVQVGKRKVALGNLKKVLFPQSEITKAEVISYYYQVAPLILRHSKGRPISTIRYPDGIEGEHFYFKDIPSWAPDWIETVRRGKEHPKNYLLLTEEATIVWLANLAALEIHQTSVRERDVPDYIVYDLDPPEEMLFEEVKETAFKLRDHLRNFGYEAYPKLSGNKGIHLFTPINPRYPVDTCFEASKLCAEPFVQRYRSSTLEISKERRKGRLLIDIYRNRGSQTVIAPYSMRGKEGAPISMPLTWEELAEMGGSDAIHFEQALQLIKQRGDVWQDMAVDAVPLHTDKEIQVNVAKGKNKHHKTPDQLQEYMKKRDFKASPEPGQSEFPMDDTAFVIHRHDASHLHYDLRLAQNGVLRSWALPKGLPQRPGVKRLAVQTEDHPMEYLNFEGDIPKKAYGGGRMWIFTRGKYEIIKEKKDGFYFRLNGPGFQAEYRMHNMKDKEWLLERVDSPPNDWLKDSPRPMLASQEPKVPRGEYSYELKWDGIRAILVVEDGEMEIYSRSGRKITDRFPEITESKLRITTGVLDAEIICFDESGKPDFRKVMGRMHQKRKSVSRNAYAYAFDLLYVDGKSIMDYPLWKRRDWLKECVGKQEEHIRFSRDEEDGVALFEATREMGLEGIMAKRLNSTYNAGTRSADWIKVKSRSTSVVWIIGYTVGENERAKTFGALHIAEETHDGLVYRGKVANGLNEKQMKMLVEKWPEPRKNPVAMINSPSSEDTDVWFAPEHKLKVKYASLTSNDVFREPVVAEILYS